jgi:transposase
MIVLGADTHKRSHTIAAVSAATGELIGEQTVQVGAKGFAALVVWARELGTERVWALEDCRHVSGSFERFLIARGERVLRVTTKLMADSRRRARGRGKADSIDAIAVARADTPWIIAVNDEALVLGCAGGAAFVTADYGAALRFSLCAMKR